MGARRLTLGTHAPALGLDERESRYVGLCHAGITAMGGKRRRDERDDPGLYDPEDEAAIQHGLREEPEGPDWWEGRWPEGGINSLDDLRKWVEERLNDFIWM